MVQSSGVVQRTADTPTRRRELDTIIRGNLDEIQEGCWEIHRSLVIEFGKMFEQDIAEGIHFNSWRKKVDRFEYDYDKMNDAQRELSDLYDESDIGSEDDCQRLVRYKKWIPIVKSFKETLDRSIYGISLQIAKYNPLVPIQDKMKAISWEAGIVLQGMDILVKGLEEAILLKETQQ